jgi:hypothetical protein
MPEVALAERQSNGGLEMSDKGGLMNDGRLPSLIGDAGDVAFYESTAKRYVASGRRFLSSKKKSSRKKSSSKKKIVKKKSGGGIQSAGIMLEKGCMKALADMGVFKILGP